jgi:predicted RNA binding protein YcfA (HicA-like mRNA interferase family)
MSKLPILSGAKLVKILCKYYDFKHDRTKGSHLVLIREIPKRLCLSVPNHKELSKGVLLGLLNKAGIEREGLMKRL